MEIKTTWYFFFLKKKMEDMSPFCGATDTPVLDFWPVFQSQGRFSCLCAFSPVYNRFLRFISGATPADPLVPLWQPSCFNPWTCTDGILSRCSHSSSPLTDSGAAGKAGGYIFTRVCHSVHRGGLPQCMLGYHTPGADPLQKQTPARAEYPQE